MNMDLYELFTDPFKLREISEIDPDVAEELIIALAELEKRIRD